MDTVGDINASVLILHCICKMNITQVKTCMKNTQFQNTIKSNSRRYHRGVIAFSILLYKTYSSRYMINREHNRHKRLCYGPRMYRCAIHRIRIFKLNDRALPVIHCNNKDQSIPFTSYSNALIASTWRLCHSQIRRTRYNKLIPINFSILRDLTEEIDRGPPIHCPNGNHRSPSRSCMQRTVLRRGKIEKVNDA